MIKVHVLSDEREFPDAHGWADEQGWLWLFQLDQEPQEPRPIALFPPGAWHGLVPGGVAKELPGPIGFRADQPAELNSHGKAGMIEVHLPSRWHSFPEANGWVRRKGSLRLVEFDERGRFQKWIAVFPPNGWHGLVTGGVGEAHHLPSLGGD